MKIKLLLFALILFGFNAYSQTESSKTLSGFWGIDFGSSIDQAKAKMNTKSGCTFDFNESNSKTLLYKGGSFAGMDVDFVSLDFYNGRFYKGVVFVFPSSESIIISNYKNLKSDLSNKYFKTEKYIEEFSSPYEEGDGYELTAIKSNKASFMSIWYFTNASMSLSITKNAKIALFYSESKTQKIVDAIEEKNNSTDL